MHTLFRRHVNEQKPIMDKQDLVDVDIGLPRARGVSETSLKRVSLSLFTSNQAAQLGLEVFNEFLKRNDKRFFFDAKYRRQSRPTNVQCNDER